MYQFILLIHVFAAVCIIALVLVQQGKGATMGAAFGSGASQTVFGSRGSGSFLFRVTISLVGVFFITSITLNYMASRAFKQEKVITLPAMPASTDSSVNNESAPAANIPAPSLPTNTSQPEDVAPASTMPSDIPARN